LANAEFVADISRREFTRLAANIAMLGTLSACGATSTPPLTPSRSEPTRSTTTTTTTTTSPPNLGRPIKLTQADLDRIIGDHAHTLLDQLRAKAPGLNNGVAVTFAYPNHQFNRFCMYGTVGDQTPPTPTTLFGIASITKTFTATLFANGVSMRPDCFDRDAGLTRYLGGYMGNGSDLSAMMRQITPRMLAQHTSGLPRVAAGARDGIGLFQQDPSTPSPSVLDVWRTHGNPPPRSCYLHSNLGFFTLGFAAVTAYGCAAGGNAPSYQRLLSEQITGPLNMPDTVTVVPGGAPVAQAHPNLGTVSAGASPDIKSSATDMHTWLLAHLGAVNGPSNLLKGITATTQSAPLSVDVCGKSERGPANMGLAWQVDPGPPLIIWKDGLTTWGGCSSWIGFTPGGPTQEPFGIAVVVNGFWNRDKPAVLADNHGHSMLKQISAAI
jgi:CubicO group peptidase (beta-lactamase class C family)